MVITLEQINKKLAEAIKHSGLSQSEIARRVGINQAQIYRYLNKQKLPSLDSFANLCLVLDVDPADIFCISEYKKEN
ncbi:MAG: helix-turn-helix transcriptional regulator [Clostridiales bacterium]|nr:helix-turn-helix transcriptional regulator [Clostridiales bacterium]